MHISGESLAVMLLVGLIAGWLAGQIMQGTGFGLIGDLVIGVVGALIASLLFPQLGIRHGRGNPQRDARSRDPAVLGKAAAGPCSLGPTLVARHSGRAAQTPLRTADESADSPATRSQLSRRVLDAGREPDMWHRVACDGGDDPSFAQAVHDLPISWWNLNVSAAPRDALECLVAAKRHSACARRTLWINA